MSKSKMAKRGRPPCEFSSTLERCLIRLFERSPVAFDRVAQAVESAGGPGKLTLRKHMQRITGTTKLADVRFAGIKSRHPELIEKRRKRRLRALDQASRRKGRQEVTSQDSASQEPIANDSHAHSSSPDTSLLSLVAEDLELHGHEEPGYYTHIMQSTNTTIEASLQEDDYTIEASSQADDDDYDDYILVKVQTRSLVQHQLPSESEVRDSYYAKYYH